MKKISWLKNTRNQNIKNVQKYVEKNKKLKFQSFYGISKIYLFLYINLKD